jgi:RHS repeat-associated protein
MSPTLSLLSADSRGIQTRRRKSRRCVPHGLRLLAALSLVAVLCATGAGQAGVCKTGVKVHFKGSACATQAFTITMAGGAASGFGNCSGNSWSNTNEAEVELRPNETYTMTAGTGICSIHVNFDVPPGYKLEINDKETTAIDKSGSSPGGGDGTWSVVLREKCACSCESADGGPPSDSSGQQVGSVLWGAALGRLSDGRSAGSINIRERFLSASTYTPAALIYSPPARTSEVEVIRTPGGALRQIKAPQALADVVTVSSTEYDIRFYLPADVGSKVNGLYTVVAAPFATWKIKNPDPATQSRLQISKTQNGVTETGEYTWVAADNSWSLTTGGGARVETKTEATNAATGERAETRIVKDGAGQIVSKKVTTYHPYAWGEELLREVLDPDGAALTTQYSYYENPSEAGKYRKVKSVTNADGSWEKYDYDAYGNTILVLRPWKDLSLASATEENSHAIRNAYSNYDGIEVSLFPHYISSVVEKVGVVVRKTTYLRDGATINGQPAVRESVTQYASDAVGQVTVTTTYHSSAADLYAGRVASVEYPDGRKETYAYERGNYVGNDDPALRQFVADASGLARRDTITHGTVSSPDGVAFKTTRETTVRDQYGRTALVETYVYRGVDYDRAAWTSTDYDDRGRLTQTARHDGQVMTAVWDGDLKTSETDGSGAQTDFTYDALRRVRTQTKKGIAAGGGYAAQPDIVTTFSYDAAGRQVGEKVEGGALSLTRSSVYDVAGRLQSETDQAGLTTGYTYSNGGRTKTTTLPGGAVQIEDNYLDGQAKSVTGTAVVAHYFDYGVNADGTQYTQEFTGSAGLQSPRWRKTTTDWLGRTIRMEKPAFSSGVTVVQGSTYNVKGQLEKETFTAGTTKLVADKLHEYDELGSQTRAGSDIDAGGTLTLASTDRVSETVTLYEQDAGGWFRVTTAKTYLIDNDATPTTSSQRERLTNFPVNGAEKTVAESIVINAAGNATKTTTSVDRAAKKVTQRVDTADSTTDAVSVTVNGLLQSSTPTTPQGATTFAYDALGRPSVVTDPRVGTATKTYNPTTGQLASEGDDAQTTSYEYYAAAQANAGKLRAKTDGNGKKVYFNYNSRGEMTQTWGDATYPSEYVFDAYGQRAELHTYRGGSGWAAGAWPISTTGAADVTRWIYHEPTGLLQKKQDAAGKQVVYAYDALGRMATRTWARTLGAGAPLSTTYAYDPNTGEMGGVDYSDATPDVTFAYDRGGRQRGVTDAAGSHARTFNARGELYADQIAGGLLDGVAVSAGYDPFLRRNSLSATRAGVTFATQTYGYDATSRLQTVTSGAQTATYAYYPNSGLLNTTAFTGGTQTARSYDALGRLQTISTTTPAAGTVASYTYTYNNLSQRTRATREDGSYWSYLYNDRGELTSGKKYWADNTAVAGQQTEYGFDSIGNRNYAKSGGDSQGVSLRQSNYTPNSLNQYSQRTNPGAVDVTGTADSAATVTVNDQPAYRKGTYFHTALAVNNATGPANVQVSVVGVKNGAGANGEDAVTTEGGSVFVPPAVESYAYDADGNLVQDGRWQYAWDAENRLVSMQALGGVPDAAKRRLDFVYDYTGRRVQKNVYGWSAGAYQLTSVTKFVYDGWNLIAELDGNNNPIRSYAWGGSELLLASGGGNTYQVGADGNGNVVSLVKASTGTSSASYEYDPFGQTLKSTGEYANQNPFGFSTKYLDQETGLIYYGHRFYNPQAGRWISKDPIGEDGGSNVYGFINNDGVNRSDYLGLIEVGQIADMMHGKNWLNGEVLLRKWMSAPANSNPASGAPDTTTIRMDTWVLTFQRAKDVYNKIFSEKAFVNDAAKRRIVRMLDRKGLFGHGNDYITFDFVSGSVVDTDKAGDFVNERYVGSQLNTPDDMVASLARFKLRMTIKGAVCAGSVVYINEVGVYAWDTYDFNDDSATTNPQTWVSQPLGFWNPKTGYVGRLPLGDYVSNATFQEYREKTHQGGDFLIYSDMKVTKLDTAENFPAP